MPMNNKRILLTLKYTCFMSVVLVVSLIIIYMLSENARRNTFQATLRSEAITKANLFLENRVYAATMHNLIENNCKYSPDLTSEITIGTHEHLTVYFADKGKGMTPVELKNLFNLFYRGTSTSESGHGIGMALVQRIVKLHHYHIAVQSKNGHGTTFFLTLRG